MPNGSTIITESIPFYSPEFSETSIPWKEDVQDAIGHTGNESRPHEEDSIYLSSELCGGGVACQERYEEGGLKREMSKATVEAIQREERPVPNEFPRGPAATSEARNHPPPLSRRASRPPRFGMVSRRMACQSGARHSRHTYHVEWGEDHH